MNREFRYINTLGLHKLLVVEEKPDAERKYACTLWCDDNGEYCGSGNLTASELDYLLSHYGLHFT